jgi:hypothetical protein
MCYSVEVSTMSSDHSITESGHLEVRRGWKMRRLNDSMVP